MLFKLIAPIAASMLALLALGAPAAAEVIRATDNSFVTRHEVVVTANPKAVWLALIAPAGWWRSEHTWSGAAANLTLTPQAGGCFCETIPEVNEPGRFTLQGSVEHMRVIQAYPESALRMVGALGPLQSEPVTGVLTIAISKAEKGTRIVWEYNVGGAMRFEVPVISKAVDGVMAAQLAALAKPLGPMAMPASLPPASVVPAPLPSGPMAPETGTAAMKSMATPQIRPSPPAAAALAPKPALKPEPKLEPKAEPKSPTVKEAFSDLGGKPPR
jgi:hypothetical protein